MNCWTSEQLLYLEEIAGSDHIIFVCKKFQAKARKENWPQRTNTAIRVKLKRLGLSQRATDGGWTCSSLAEILEVRRDRVQSWVSKGLLKSNQPPGSSLNRITQGEFRKFARNYPDWLTDISGLNLSILLEEEDVNTILAQPIRRRGVAMPVYNLKTKKTYNSIREAARHEFFGRTTIWRSLRTPSRLSPCSTQ